MLTGASSEKQFKDIARAAAEQHNTINSTYIVAANSGRSSRSSTSRKPKAAPGKTVEAGEHGGARRGKVKWRPRWGYFAVGESRHY